MPDNTLAELPANYDFDKAEAEQDKLIADMAAKKKALNPSQLSWSGSGNSFKIYDPDTDTSHKATLGDDGKVSFSPNYNFKLLNQDRINVNGKPQIPDWLTPYSVPQQFSLKDAPEDLKQ